MPKPFDLQKALEGHPLVTRSGEKALSFQEGPYPYKYINIQGDEIRATKDGRFYYHAESAHDLFLADDEPEKTTGLSFSEALEFLKIAKNIRRHWWPPYSHVYMYQSVTSNQLGDPWEPMLRVKTGVKKDCVWNPNTGELLAEDWEVCS